MPLYEYACDSCTKVHEIIQKFSDPLLSECPDCQQPVRKLISRTSFQLKGTGWYATDYKKPSAPKSDSPAPVAEAAASPATPAVAVENKSSGGSV